MVTSLVEKEELPLITTYVIIATCIRDIMMCFQDCQTKAHSVCENHNGIWKNCVDQPRFEIITFGRPISSFQGGVYRETSHKGDREVRKGEDSFSSDALKS